ncbi:hypothetical protein [Isoptericola cucumis]|uniref:Uncharacterized protein n=1 Tax=Isoptericola cucumis TaxID=1776856 RepID=A0ABQ2B0X9_9MICO|nr:hypothetical protein [Isoptericola cucumis]GGI05239.1 hypothetical protein GCM10007368_05160 [Isoptericola cucumis]
MRKVQWSSVATVVGAVVVAVLMLVLVLRGRVWAWIPFALAAGIAVREIRFLQRARRPDAGFDEQRRGRPSDR